MNSMKCYVGFAFTETPVETLQDKGFLIIKDFSSAKSFELGYESFLVPLDNSHCFQIRVVLEEEKYLTQHAIKHFEAFETEATTQQIEMISAQGKPHVNTVDKFIEVFKQDNLPWNSVKTYLELRKRGHILALHLHATDFKTFQKQARPDKEFVEGHQTLALVHLGPQCFDLIVDTK